MKFLTFIFITAFVTFCLAKENQLKFNKTPKEHQVQPVDFTSVCDECTVLVERFKEAAKDPAKMAILKEMLSVLCHETDYEEECKIFVSKLDIFIDKLLPYLKNPHAVCAKFHMCSNSRIDRFHRVGLLFAKRYLNKLDGAKDLICEECQFAAHELLEVIDDHSTQVQIHDFISGNVCAHLGQYRGTCDVLIDDFLPDLFQELHNMLSNGKQFCTDLKLCPASPVNLQRRVTEMKEKRAGPKYLKSLIKQVTSLKTKEPHQLDMSCLECKVMVDAILTEFKTDPMLNGTRDVLNTILCVMILPPEFGCTDFISIYGSTIVYMTLEQFDSETMCESMNMCQPNSYAQLSKYSSAELNGMKCDACEGIKSFMRVELGKSKTRLDVIYGIQHMICKEAPRSLHNICDNFTKGYLPIIYDKFLMFLQKETACKAVHAC